MGLIFKEGQGVESLDSSFSFYTQLTELIEVMKMRTPLEQYVDLVYKEPQLDFMIALSPDIIEIQPAAIPEAIDLDALRETSGVSEKTVRIIAHDVDEYWNIDRAMEVKKDGEEKQTDKIAKEILDGKVVLGDLGNVIGFFGDVTNSKTMRMLELLKGKAFFSRSFEETGNENAVAIMLNMYEIMQVVDMEALSPELQPFFVDVSDIEKLQERKKEFTTKKESGTVLTTEEEHELAKIEQRFAEIRTVFAHFRARGQGMHWRIPIKDDAKISGEISIPKFAFSTKEENGKLQRYIQVVDIASQNPEFAEINRKVQKGGGLVFGTSGNPSGEKEGIWEEHALQLVEMCQTTLQLDEAQQLRKKHLISDQTDVSNYSLISRLKNKLPAWLGSYPAVFNKGDDLPEKDERGGPVVGRHAAIHKRVIQAILGLPHAIPDSIRAKSNHGNVEVDPENATVIGNISFSHRALALQMYKDLQEAGIAPSEIHDALNTVFARQLHHLKQYSERSAA